MSSRSSGFFVTGTDTDVGKTLAACALLRALGASGLRVIGMKPVAAGGDTIGGRLVNADVAALMAESNVQAPAELVNPYCFAQPIAPHIAAALAGVSIDLGRIGSAYDALAARAECVVVEGAGGFRVPLGARVDTADLAASLGLPVVLVVGMRLGCLNHAILTAAAIRAAGLALAGWVANHIDRDMMYADENVAAIAERLDAPLIARIPFLHSPDAAHAAGLLDVGSLRAKSS